MRRYLAVAAALALLAACSGKGPEGRAGHAGHEGAAGPGAGPGEAKKTLYHCPMHPTYVSDKPGECPICGMTLVPVEEEGGGGGGLEGHARVRLDARRRQLIGLTTGKVERRSLDKTIRTVGRIAFDPELYRTQEEYLSALKAYGQGRDGAIPESRERARSLVGSSKLRLQSLGLSDEQIAALARSAKPEVGLLIAPGKGGSLWLYADVYESELGLVRQGQEVEAVSASLPGEVFRGKVASIDRVINPKTRSARVRVRVEDPRGLLRPDTYLSAAVRVPLGERLSVPEEAVVNSGLRQIVFVDEGDGFLEPREVLLGVRSESFVEVREGLAEGERVVTSGNFLIDSESRLKAALSAIAGAHGH